jgi:hypothetical protein
MMLWNGVRQSQSKFDDVKDRVQTAHGLGEFQMIGTTANPLDYFERTQMTMRYFLDGRVVWMSLASRYTLSRGW